jgi:C1A family cysteine protease
VTYIKRTTGGWREDREDDEFIDGLRGEAPILAMRGTYTEATFDPRKVMRVENQGSQGACQGHAISSVVEWCHCIATGNAGLQLSRAYGYYETQRLDGIRGDRGSTISGGVKLAMGAGIPEEKFWPYPRGYNSRRPKDFESCLKNAKQYRIKTKRRITTYEGARAFLGSGQGGITIGIGWSSRVMSKAVVESFKSGGGGHAICLMSLSKRKDRAGDPFLWMCNSWGTRWGNGGWSEWSPKAVRQILASGRTTAIGLSDMVNVKPREFTLADWKKTLRG